MKLSISIPEEQVAALDRYAQRTGLPSRSAAIQQAIRVLGDRELEESYVEAWEEWNASGDAASWEITGADGLSDAAR